MDTTLPQNGTPNLTVGPQVAQGIDPKYITLAKAIRQTESGGNPTAIGKSGEFGAYQFEPTTWAAEAPKFGVNVPIQQATLEQQNQVAVNQLAEWGKEHPDWNVGNFASAWNAGAGKPNAYLEGNVGTNSRGVSYDTPTYAKNVATAYQQFKAQSATNQIGTPSANTGSISTTQQTPLNPTLGGFAQNVLTSGAGLLGGVGEAVLHPIKTVQNVGGIAAGGFEKLAGETTDNTQKFDNLIQFLKNRYGSINNLEKTLYTDPVGIAADISTLFGGAGVALKGAKIGADIAKLGEVGGVLGKAGEALGTASEFTNPLTPIAHGIGALVKPAAEAATGILGKIAGFEPTTIDAIRANPSAFKSEQIANTTRDTVASEVENAFNNKIQALSDTGKEYAPLREVPQTGSSFSAENLIPVSKNFLEDQLRQTAGLDVKDGEVVATGNSTVRNATDISKLQKTLDLWKPIFQKGTLTPNEFLNFRSDMAELAKFGLGEKKSSVLENASKEIRANLNTQYRSNIPGLEELDAKFSAQQSELQQLKKGLITKDGKLTDTATNLIANAGNKGNETRLARLERVVPGITEKLKVLKAIEDIQKAAGIKAGTYTRSILETGGVVGGLSTGHLSVVAAGIAAAIIAEPSTAVKLIRAAEKIDPKITSLILVRLARYATIGSESNRATEPGTTDQTGMPETQNQVDNSPSGQDGLSSGTTSPLPQSNPQEGQVSKTLEDLASTNNFDLAAARKEGYTDQEIQDYLSKSQ